MLAFFQAEVALPGIEVLAQYGALGVMLAYLLFKDNQTFKKMSGLLDRITDTLDKFLEEKEERYQLRKKVDSLEERIARLEIKQPLA